jgi:hypothetical protein
MHLDSASARSHAADLAARRVAAERLAAAEASARSEVRLESRPAAAPRLIVRRHGHATAPIQAAFSPTMRIGSFSTATNDHALAHRRPPDDWPVGTLLPAGSA